MAKNGGTRGNTYKGCHKASKKVFAEVQLSIKGKRNKVRWSVCSMMAKKKKVVAVGGYDM